MALDRIDVLVSQKSVAWRLVNSLWIVVIIIGLGIFSTFGWLWAGILARSSKIWRIVAAWGIVVALTFLSTALSENNKNSFWNALGGVLLMISWIGSLVHAFIVRGAVLREIVAREDELSRLRAYEQYTTRPGFRTTSRRTPPRRCPCRPAAPRSRPGVPRGFRLRDRCLRSYGSTWASTTGSRPANGRCHRIRWLHRCPKPHPSNRSPFQHHQHHQYRQHHPHHHCRRCRQPPVST